MPALPAASRYSEPQEQRVGRRFGAADRGWANPQHRDALRFQKADHLFDFLGVELDPAFLPKLINAVGRGAS
jgi:hypothetical protein